MMKIISLMRMMLINCDFIDNDYDNSDDDGVGCDDTDIIFLKKMIVMFMLSLTGILYDICIFM